MSELAVIDPKEFGLEEKQSAEIMNGLSTIIEERGILIDAYKDIINDEVTEENIPVFKSLRLQISKNRTQGIEKWRVTNKAYFLAGGNFVQAISNREQQENKRMEEQLLGAEKHFENIEAKRVCKLTEERTIELSNYDPEMIIPNLGEMEESVWKNFIQGIKLSFEQRKADEEKAEKERLRLIEAEKETARLKAIENERIRKENDRLKKEAEAKEKALEKERESARKELEAKEAKAAAAEKIRVAEQKKKDDAAAKLLADEKSKARKLQDEIKAKAAAAEKERLVKEKADKAAAQAPDKDKLIKSINEMTFIDAEFKTVEAEAVYNVINQKFEAFKTWAVKQTESL